MPILTITERTAQNSSGCVMPYSIFLEYLQCFKYGGIPSLRVEIDEDSKVLMKIIFIFLEQ